MSAEVTTSIVRPDIYSECRGCWIALRAIKDWLTYKPRVPHQFARTTEITISCTEKDGQVMFQVSTTQLTQYIKDEPILEIPGGDPSPSEVSCPHFSSQG
jgi:hypothetical protein